VFYSVGAVLNSLQWPEPYPPVFGAHEVFHLFVMTGSLFHYYFMLSAVLPYRPRRLASPAALPSLAAGAACQPVVSWPLPRAVPETAANS
jgi:hypothetical protein